MLHTQAIADSVASSSGIVASPAIDDDSDQRSDMFYAQALVNFHHAHGHYAPTIAQGGPALTQWVRQLREAFATNGVVRCTGNDLGQALALLKERIANFDLAQTVPAAANVPFAMADTATLAKGSRLKGRKAAVVDCAWNATRLQLSPLMFFLRLPKHHNDLPLTSLMLLKIAQRAIVFHQGLKAQYTVRPDAAVQTWWITGVVPILANERSAESPFALNMRRVCPLHGVLDEFTTPEIVELVGCGYSMDGSEYAVAFRCKDGSQLRLSYDALLADVSHPHVAPFEFDRSFFLGSSLPSPFNWQEWLSSTDAPQRHRSSASTCNRAFERNLAKLKAWLDANAGNKHLTWSGAGPVYKFVEHQLLKMSQRTLGFSHRERLAALGFTWGMQHQTAQKLFGAQ